MPSRNLLLVTYHWPPFPGAGSARWTAMAKYLRRLGHEVTVVTTSAHGSLEEDVRDGVVRTPDLAAAGSLRRLLRRPPLPEPGAAAAGRPAPRILTGTLVPDAYAASWTPFATSAVRRIMRRRSVDCLITSSPPDSAHLVGLALRNRRPAWIADLRDGWTFEPLRPAFPTRAQRRLDLRLERSVIESADATVVATEPIARDLEARFGVAAATIANAWDPDLDPEVERAIPPKLEGDRVNLVYTGTFGGVRGHDDRGLLAALRGIVRDEAELAARLRLVIAGSLTAAEEAALSASDLAPVVRYLGLLPRLEALALQRHADALLLVTSADSSISTAKIFEYLAAGRPILALAGRNEAARIVEETGTGLVVQTDDVPRIRRALAAVVAGEMNRNFRPRNLVRYRYPAPVEALSEVIETAEATRRRTR